MELFYDPQFAGTGRLNEAESKHCINVLRHKLDDIITVTNGKGSFFECQITSAHPKRCELNLLSHTTEKERPFKLHLAVAPTKSSDRLEWLLEKAVELGVDEITLLQCHHSERKKVRPERIEKVVIAAMKQSLKARLPKINPLTSFKTFIKETGDYHPFIAHCHASTKEPLKKCYAPNTNALVCIGPEGDFSEQEVADAMALGFTSVSLGDSRLRTETAGLIACHTIHLFND